jgi:hypothetical protein
MKATAMYEVWHSVGNGMQPGPRFRRLCDALRHVLTHLDLASFAVRTPDGRWYRDRSGRSIFARRSRS